MKMNPKMAGLVQALGLGLYVGFFVALVQFIQQWFILRPIAPNPIFSAFLFLLAFVISALVCGSIVFIYPIFLFFAEKKNETIEVVIWTAIWLIFMFLILLILGFVLTANKS